MDHRSINIVWLKRDIRSQDHAPFQAAEDASIPYLVVYLFEPSIIRYRDTSLRHLQFIFHSLTTLNRTFSEYNRSVHVFYGEADEVFTFLNHEFNIQSIFSHQESGVQITYDRDVQLASFFKKRNIQWIEFQRDGIQRGIKNREGWDKQWYGLMHRPIIKNQYKKANLIHLEHPFQLPADLQEKLEVYPSSFQKAGENYAWRYLNSFTENRGFNYHRYISKPTYSRESCGRLSPYLAWGNLSIKQAYQHIYNHPNCPSNKRAFLGIMTRLKWHCHFIQKFEVECRYETECINKGYESLKHENSDRYLEAWKTGNTGYPMVDACMRALRKTGWINFRMRAMLVSFLCFHLDQDWRRGVYHLANLFLDYEPGIHYPQFQMQAGTTGINTVRMYNPIKQSEDHDPKGEFIKKWIPELAKVPEAFIHKPWELTQFDLVTLGIDKLDYPAPIVDCKSSAKKARDKIWSHRKDPAVQQESQRILATHVRKKR